MTIAAGNVLTVREWRDRRVIAGLRFVDATTGGSVLQPLQVQAAGSQFVRNRSGIYVLLSAPGFEDYVNTFETSAGALSAVEPAATSLMVTVQDVSGQYLPRQYLLALPRNTTGGPTTENALFQPVSITLYPAAIAPTHPNWAVLRTTVLNSSNQRLPWALIRTTVNEETTLTQADWRGEALIAIAGIPTVAASMDAASTDPSTRAFPASLQVVFDPVLNTFDEDTNLIEQPDPNPNYLPNPDQLNDNRAALQTGTEALILTSGQRRSLRLAVLLT